MYGCAFNFLQQLFHIQCMAVPSIFYNNYSIYNVWPVAIAWHRLCFSFLWLKNREKRHSPSGIIIFSLAVIPNSDLPCAYQRSLWEMHTEHGSILTKGTPSQQYNDTHTRRAPFIFLWSCMFFFLFHKVNEWRRT